MKVRLYFVTFDGVLEGVQLDEGLARAFAEGIELGSGKSGLKAEIEAREIDGIYLETAKRSEGNPGLLP